MTLGLIMAAKHEAFSRTEEANGAQFSLTMEVLPLTKLENWLNMSRQ